MVDIVAGCQARRWYEDIPADEYLGDIHTMLSHGERLMLHWLAKNLALTENGSIIDAGCFLGGSTLALATGLGQRHTRDDQNYRIHTYDIFIAPNDGYSLKAIGNSRRPGQTVLDLFAKNVENFCEKIFVHGGDFLKSLAPHGGIDILFIDIAKTRDLNRKLVEEFFPKLIPGHSILIQQDYNDHSCPWINATMEILSEYFEYLIDESGSRIFLLTKEIPVDLIRHTAQMGLEDELSLLKTAVRNERVDISRFFTSVGAGWTILELSGSEAAIEYLNTLQFDQPWESDVPYINDVKAAMELVKNTDGLKKYHSTFFSKSVI